MLTLSVTGKCRWHPQIQKLEKHVFSTLDFIFEGSLPDFPNV